MGELWCEGAEPSFEQPLGFWICEDSQVSAWNMEIFYPFPLLLGLTWLWSWVVALRAPLSSLHHRGYMLVPICETHREKGLQSSTVCYLLSFEDFLVNVSGFQRNILAHPSGPMPYALIILSVDHLLGTSCLFLRARRDHGIALALLGCQGGWIATVSV